LQHTRDVFYLGEKEIAVLTKDSVRVTDFDGNVVEPKQQRITWDPIAAEKGGFKHFMLKEIYEQPRAVRDTVRGRVSLDSGKGLSRRDEYFRGELKSIRSITVAACGTSWHAGIAGKYMLEQMARVPEKSITLRNFGYRNPVLDENTLLIVISQSGETADTIAAMRRSEKIRLQNARRLQRAGFDDSPRGGRHDLTHAGPEIGVASTKAFTAQMIALYLFALYLGQLRGKSTKNKRVIHAQQLAELPLKIEHLLNDADSIEELSRDFSAHRIFLSRARHQFPVALEGALKLKGNQLHSRRRLPGWAR
jgi:glucosamine--fructose-6-phosphate aminotransferase (isomerizing)